MKQIVFFKSVLILMILFIVFDYLISNILLTGLNKFYGFNQEANILINGSSMIMSGLNRTDIEHLTNTKIACYSYEGVSVDDRYAMISHFFSINSHSVKTVIYEVNPLLFSDRRTSENVYKIFYPYMDNKDIDQYIHERASCVDYFLNKLIRTKRFDSRLFPPIIMGYLGKYNTIKKTQLDTTQITNYKSQKGKTPVIMERSKVEVFENTMNIIKSNNANIILVMMPIFYMKMQTFDNESYNNLCKYFESYSLSRQNVKYLDLNNENLNRKAKYFSDPLHYNIYGQKQISHLISLYLIDN
jgi:hypothetical protein